MATNEILRFAEIDTGTNLLTQTEYSADSQRPIGNQPGVARSKLVNKALRQSSLIAAAVAQFIADNQANNVVDTATPAGIADWIEAAVCSITNADRPFEASTANIKMDGTQSVGTLNTVARGDHVHPTDTSRVAKAGDTMTGRLSFKGGTLEAGGGFNSAADNDSGMDFPADGHVRLRSNARVAVEALPDGTVKTWYGGNYIACQPDGNMVVYDTHGAAKHVFRGNGSYTATDNIESQANIYGRGVIAKQTAIICNRNNESQQWHIFSDNDRDLKFHSTVAGGTVGYINREGKIYTTGYGWLHDKFAPLASPALTGTPTAPTAPVGTNTTQVATTAFVNAEIAAGDYPRFNTYAVKSNNLSDLTNKPQAIQNLGLQLPLGQGQSLQDVTSIRSTGVVYTNTTGRTIEVTLAITHAELNYTATYYVNGIGVNWSHAGYSIGVIDSVTFTVANGETYSANKFTLWLERRV